MTGTVTVTGLVVETEGVMTVVPVGMLVVLMTVLDAGQLVTPELQEVMVMTLVL